jgi:hypothetical protein
MVKSKEQLRAALLSIARGAFKTDALGNCTFTLEAATKIARDALGMAERVNYGGQVRLNTPNMMHLYELEVENDKRGDRVERILVEANTRKQAINIACTEGYSPHKCYLLC